MRRFSWLNISLLLIFVSAVAIAKPTGPSLPVMRPKPPSIAANSYLLMDCDSKQILAEKDIDTIVEPASLTKMMTVYIVDSEMKAGRLQPTDDVLISKKAWQSPGSRMFLNVDTKVQVQELLKGVIIQSGNDASVALAEHIAGSEQAFAELMNAYAKMLGMNHTHFANASGLPNPEHVTTARDMAILGRAIIKDFPESYKVYSQKEFIYNGIKQTNRNRLLWRSDKYDGIKTGHTDNAGFCIVASGKEDNMRLIAVVMGANSENARTEESNKLLAWGFRFFETNLVYKAGTGVKEARVWMGSSKNINVGFEEDLYVTTAKGQYSKCNSTVNVTTPLKAPLKRNDVVGSFLIRNNADDVILEQSIVALQDVKQGNIWHRGRDYVTQNINSLIERMGL